MKFAWMCVAMVITVGLATQIKSQTDPASQVDPLIGTKTNQFKDNGNTVPGATRPFGMLYWSPDPANGDFYRYEAPVVRGFGLTHISGPGCGTLGDAPMMVMKGKLQKLPFVRSAPIQSAFRHEDEIAEPGYYAVKLDSGIRVQLAAAQRSGLAEIDFPDDGDVHTLFVDASRNLTRVNDASVSVANGRMTGSVTSAGFVDSKTPIGCTLPSNLKARRKSRAPSQRPGLPGRDRWMAPALADMPCSPPAHERSL